jgi:hypothetical protein
LKRDSSDVNIRNYAHICLISYKAAILTPNVEQSATRGGTFHFYNDSVVLRDKRLAATFAAATAPCGSAVGERADIYMFTPRRDSCKMFGTRFV